MCQFINYLVQDSRQSLLYGVTSNQPIVHIDEVCIVGVVLLVWAAAVYVFFNQWGEKIYCLLQLLMPKSADAAKNGNLEI
jgi:hypothetical protein